MASTTSGEPPASLLSLPPEVLVDSIIPLLAPADIASLSATNKLLHSLCNDPAIWRTKTQDDFSYRATGIAIASTSAAAATSGWYKRVYLGLRKPRTYIWGSHQDGRMGSTDSIRRRVPQPTDRNHAHFRHWVDAPMDVTDTFDTHARERGWRQTLNSEPGAAARYTDSATPPAPASVVDLQAGGWSFAARDVAGGVWVWGKLNGGTMRAYPDNWGNEGALVEEPTRIPLPAQVEAIAVGRQHMLVLDKDNLVWEMKAWGKAYRHTAPEMTAPTSSGAAAPGRKQHIVQVEAGWNVSACLMASGDIVAWNPFTQEYKASLTSEDAMHGPLGADGDDLSRTFYWGTVGADVVHRLEAIPRERPKGITVMKDQYAAIEAAFGAAEAKMTDPQRDEAQRVVKIACGVDMIFALKGNGEVWVSSIRMQWQFLPYFSSPSITHITAQWANFFTYTTADEATDSSSVNVLKGWFEAWTSVTGLTLRPTPLPGLDGLPIVHVVSGDWHYLALTANGEVYAWGKNDWGQCGLDSMLEDITTPTRVQFPKDGEQEAFAFTIAAAGMHSGCLVLGHPLTEAEKEQQRKAAAPVQDPRDAPPPYDGDAPGTGGRGGAQPIGRLGFLPGRFRIGLAGARGLPGFGRGRGGGGSRGGSGPPGEGSGAA